MAEVLHPCSLNACKKMVNFKALRFQHLPLRQPNALTVGIGQVLRRKELVSAGFGNCTAIFIVGQLTRDGLLHPD